MHAALLYVGLEHFGALLQCCHIKVAFGEYLFHTVILPCAYIIIYFVHSEKYFSIVLCFSPVKLFESIRRFDHYTAVIISDLQI